MRIIKQYGHNEQMVQESRTINQQELAAFAEVVKAGGVTAAAETLGTSKSTVSMQISRLEARLGVTLLTRTSRRIALTREGARILPRVISLLAETEHLLDDVEREASQPRGIVRIATTPAFGDRAICVLGPKVREMYPDIKLIVKPTYDFDDLQDPSFDFAVRVGKINDENLVAIPLGSFHRQIVASPDLASRINRTDPTQLEHVDCLAFSANETQHIWQLINTANPSKTASVPIDANIAIRDFSTLLSLTKSDQGVGFLADFVTKTDLDNGHLVNCLPNWQSKPAEVMLAYRFGATRITRVKSVIDLARETIGQLLNS